MPERDDITRITIRFPTVLYQRLDDERHHERTTFQKLGVMLFTAWLTEKQQGDTEVSSGKDSLASSGGSTSISALSNNVWHDMLDRILASQHRPAIEAIVRNLHAFDILVSSDEKGRDDDYSVPLLPEEVAEFYPDIAKTLADLEEVKREEREGVAGTARRDRARSHRRTG
jgi:hypothetical protein